MALISFNSCQKKSDPTTPSLNFLVVGDWGRQGLNNQQQVADQMNKTAIAQASQFVISTGDNFYEVGVKSTTDSQWAKSYENIYSGTGLQIDWYVVLGNHDYQTNPQAQVDYSKLSSRWKMPSRYFTLVKNIDTNNAVRFIFLDTNPMILEYITNPSAYADIAQQNIEKQLSWLDSTLAASTEKYKIVVGHHPVYSAGFGHGDQPEMINLVQPILNKYNVSLYLCGHSHSSQYIKRTDTKTEYIVAGAGSSTDELITSQTDVLFGSITPSFTTISITNDGITSSFIDQNGGVMFSTKKVN